MAIHVGSSATALVRPRWKRRDQRAWLSLVLAEIAFLVTYFSFPGNSLFLWPPVGLAAVIGTFVGIRRYRPVKPAAWYLLAASELCFVAGDTTYRVLTRVLHQVNPFPSIADGFYLLTYPLFAAGLFLLIRGRSRTRDTASLLDGLIITLGLAFLSWTYLITPYFHAAGLTVTQRIVSVGYPLGDVLVLAMLARMLVGGGLRIASIRLLALGGGGLLAADVCYGYIQLNGTWQVGGPVDIGWAIYYTAWGAAALHPSMRQVNQIAPRPDGVTSLVRVAVLGAATLIPPGVLVWESVNGQVQSGTTVGVFSAGLFLLVTTRLWGIVSAQRASVQRERVLRSHGDALVAAQNPEDVYRAAVDGAILVHGADGGTHASLYLLKDRDIRCVATSPTGTCSVQDLSLWTLALDGGFLDPDGSVSVSSLRRDREVIGMLVVRSDVPLNYDEHGSMASLALQVALALESATLAAELRLEQNEAHFRGLIQNASDVIVVVDALGRISYATPSLERALGRPLTTVLGSPLSDLLGSEDVAGAKKMLAALALRPPGAQAVADWHLHLDDGSDVSFEVLSSNLLTDPSVAGTVLTMRDVTDRRALEEQLKHQAFHDSLTGLANRTLFQDRSEHALARLSRLPTTTAMLMLDLDDFKIVNDARGHGAGDELLVQVARRLEDALRDGSTVARFGGDEFAILIEDLPDADAAEAVAARALLLFEQPFLVQGEQLTVRASAGLVVTDGLAVSMSPIELLRCADIALYAAKDSGKGNVVRYYDDLSARMMAQLALRGELRQALDSGQFLLHYQPIVSIETGGLVGVEALVRWQHPVRGLLQPAEFIGTAEEAGLIVELGGWVLDRACAQARTWADMGFTDVAMSVNVSGRQLEDSGFVEEVRSALLRSGTPAEALVVELTESVLVSDDSVVRQHLVELKNVGVRIALDDFGTGYSCLAYLADLPIDSIKVDKSFVDGLGTLDADRGALAAVVVSLAHTLRLEVIAEGIERVAQSDELWSLGCLLGQGFLYSKPVSADEISAVLVAGRRLGPTAGHLTRGQPQMASLQ